MFRQITLITAGEGGGKGCSPPHLGFQHPTRPSDCVFTYRNLEAGEPLGVQESLEEFHRACARIKRESTLFIPLYEPEVWRRHPGGRVA